MQVNPHGIDKIKITLTPDDIIQSIYNGSYSFIISTPKASQLSTLIELTIREQDLMPKCVICGEFLKTEEKEICERCNKIRRR